MAIMDEEDTFNSLLDTGEEVTKKKSKKFSKKTPTRTRAFTEDFKVDAVLREKGKFTFLFRRWNLPMLFMMRVVLKQRKLPLWIPPQWLTQLIFFRSQN